MNVGTLLPFPPSPMYYSYYLPGVEWNQHAIGVDEMLVGGGKVRCSAEGSVGSDKNGRIVRTYKLVISFSLAHLVFPTDFGSGSV